MTNPRRKSRIPKFKTLEEAADFWDTHDTTEFEDEFVEVELKFAHPLKHSFEFELKDGMLDELMAMARSTGTSVGDLVRRWINEGIEREKSSTTKSRRTSA